MSTEDGVSSAEQRNLPPDDANEKLAALQTDHRSDDSAAAALLRVR